MLRYCDELIHSVRQSFPQMAEDSRTLADILRDSSPRVTVTPYDFNPYVNEQFSLVRTSAESPPWLSVWTEIGKIIDAYVNDGLVIEPHSSYVRGFAYFPPLGSQPSLVDPIRCTEPGWLPPGASTDGLNPSIAVSLGESARWGNLKLTDVEALEWLTLSDLKILYRSYLMLGYDFNALQQFYPEAELFQEVKDKIYTLDDLAIGVVNYYGVW